MNVVPMTLSEANAFVREHHRHHGPVVGHKYSVGVEEGGEVVGVAITGRPVSRHLDDGWTLEVTRCCTDGTPNAASCLYAACWRAARAMGYRQLITYTLAEEEGTSLEAAGWRVVHQTEGGSWDRPSRPRVDKHPTQRKLRWEASA